MPNEDHNLKIYRESDNFLGLLLASSRIFIEIDPSIWSTYSSMSCHEYDIPAIQANNALPIWLHAQVIRLMSHTSLNRFCDWKELKIFYRSIGHLNFHRSWFQQLGFEQSGHWSMITSVSWSSNGKSWISVPAMFSVWKYNVQDNGGQCVPYY